MALFAGPCSSLSCRVLLPHTKCTELSLPPFSRSRSSPCAICTHAPPPDRSVPLQWLAPQFGMASLCRYGHSLERFLRHYFLNLRLFYLVVLGLGAPLSSPT